ncbi:MAG: hypothetical protein AAB378_00235 [Patescibacteria group bacterium]
MTAYVAEFAAEFFISIRVKNAADMRSSVNTPDLKTALEKILKALK